MQSTQRSRTSSPSAALRLGGLLAIVGLVAACGPTGGGATAGATTAAATTPPAATTAPTTAAETMAPTAAATSAAGLTLELAEDATLGSYVAGEDGMALYIFTPDAESPGKSVCNGECATNWPPLMADSAADVAAGTGVTGEIGTITRDDGTTQVTLGGNPLYYFIGDEAAGDVKGQGLNDVWYLAGPDGEGVGMSGGTGSRGNY